MRRFFNLKGGEHHCKNDYNSMETKVLLFTEDPKSGQAIMQIEAPDGNILNLGFCSAVPLHQKRLYTKVIKSYVDKYYADGKLNKEDFFSFLTKNLYRNNCEGLFYISPERNAERERIGARIKQMREEQFMESKDLAKRVGIDPANMCRIEQGKYSPGLDILCKIAQALNAHLDFVRTVPIRPVMCCGSVEYDFKKNQHIARLKAEKIKNLIHLKEGDTKEIPFWTEDIPELICIGKFHKQNEIVSYELDFSQSTL